jgi:hypothetical protein
MISDGHIKTFETIPGNMSRYCVPPNREKILHMVIADIVHALESRHSLADRSRLVRSWLRRAARQTGFWYSLCGSEAMCRTLSLAIAVAVMAPAGMSEEQYRALQQSVRRIEDEERLEENPGP